MQITNLFAALLLAAPAMVMAAPAAEPAGLSVPDFNGDAIFARFERTCAPTPETDAAKLKVQKEWLKKMSDYTKEYKKAEKDCPSTANTQFDTLKKKQKDKAKKLQNECITAYKTCADKRKAANNACTKAGGVVDEGHKKAVEVCKDNAAKWRAKKA